MKNKKAAMEMSIGTIVTIALLMVVLVMGMYLVRTIMCSGINLTEDISESVTNEVKGLFGVNEYGIKCMGEPGNEVTLGDGGARSIICIINTDIQTNYELTVKEVKSLSGVPTNIVQNWISDKNWEGPVSPGIDSKVVLELNIPRNVDATRLKITILEKNKDTGATKEHISRIDVKHVGTLNSAIC